MIRSRNQRLSSGNERKDEGKRWEGLKPNINLMQECISERELMIVTSLGCEYLPKPFGWKRASFSLSGLEEMMLELLKCSVLGAEKGRTVQTLCKKYIQEVLSTPLC